MTYQLPLVLLPLLGIVPASQAALPKHGTLRAPSPPVVTCEEVSRDLLHMPAVRVGGAITAPARLHYVAPNDPDPPVGPPRRRAWVADVLIGPDGGVHRIALLDRPGFERPSPAIDAAIWRAASLWKYAMTVVDGRAVPVCLSVVVDVEPKRMPSGTAPEPEWTFAPQDAAKAVAISASGRCVAVVTWSKLVMINTEGGVLWKAPLPDTADVRVQWDVAVAPACDWAAVWTSDPLLGVLVFEQDGTSRTTRLAYPGDPAEPGARYPRSFTISPDGSRLALGTDDGSVVIVTRSDLGTRHLGVSTSHEPVEVQFSPDGTHLLVTAWYTVGLIGLDGRWLWHRTNDIAQIAPGRGFTAFAARFVPAHGPQGGHVAFLDAEGRTRWIRPAWDPSTAMSPDGRVIAVSEAAWPDRTLRSEGPWTLSIVDGAGNVLAHRQIDTPVEPWIQGFSADGSCVILREKHEPAWDLVGRNLRLEESWRIPDAWHGSEPPRFRNDADLLLVLDRGTLRAYRMPGCGSGS